MTVAIAVYVLASLLLWYITDDVGVALLWPVGLVLLIADMVRVAWWRFRARKERAVRQP